MEELCGEEHAGGYGGESEEVAEDAIVEVKAWEIVVSPGVDVVEIEVVKETPNGDACKGGDDEAMRAATNGRDERVGGEAGLPSEDAIEEEDVCDPTESGHADGGDAGDGLEGCGGGWEWERGWLDDAATELEIGVEEVFAEDDDEEAKDEGEGDALGGGRGWRDFCEYRIVHELEFTGSALGWGWGI